MNLLGWLESGLTYMAMTDYPYPCDFLEPMPAWPVDVFCNSMTDSSLNALASSIGVYYNYTGESSCYNITEDTTSALGNAAWNYQACTEMIFAISSNDTSDFFPASFFNLESYIEYCQDSMEVTPRPYWMTTQFGGWDISSASNIVFSNGMLDPWRGGGIQESLSDSLIAVLIEDGAHHLDLRTPNPDDPDSVVAAREIEISYIYNWIADKLAK